MGLLRTLLALSVVIYHAWPGQSVLVGGPGAVQCFYIISGFLISYILVERRSYFSVGAFYINRYLRLYPTYLLIAVLTLAAVLVTHRSGLLQVYHQAPWSAIGVLTFSNLTLLGQDWIMFLGVHDHHLMLTSNFHQSDVPLFEGQLIHPSWTLGLELTFYLLAPFVLPRRRWMYALLIGSLALRVILIQVGLGERDPWSYRFFPTELALFLLGSLAHQILLPLYRRLTISNGAAAANVATLILLALVLAYPLLPIVEPYRKIVLLLAVIAIVPFAFQFQRAHRSDSWIGELSYPIYICHILVLDLMHYALRHFAGISQAKSALAATAATIGLAVLLNLCIAEPIERLRNRVRASRPEAGSTPATAVAG